MLLHLELFRENQIGNPSNALPTIDYDPLCSEYPVLDAPSDSTFSTIANSACLNSESSAHRSDQLEDLSRNRNTAPEHGTPQSHSHSAAEDEPGGGEDKSGSGREESGSGKVSGKDKSGSGRSGKVGGKDRSGSGREGSNGGSRKHGKGKPGIRRMNEEGNSDAQTDEVVDEVQSKDDDLGTTKPNVRLRHQILLSDLHFVCLASLL